MQNSFNNCGGSMIPSMRSSGLSLGEGVFPNFPTTTARCTASSSHWWGNCFYVYFSCDMGNGVTVYFNTTKCLTSD